jgi:hypothetical protein
MNMKTAYQVTAADRLPMPSSYADEPRQLGYDSREQKRPFAHYFQPQMLDTRDSIAG